MNVVNDTATLAMQSASFVFVLLGALAIAVETPSRWSPVLLAFVSGPLSALLLTLYAGAPLTPQTGAGIVLAGVLAAGSALGIDYARTRVTARRVEARVAELAARLTAMEGDHR